MDRPPIIVDPEHLTAVAGSAYLVIRPTGALVAAFRRIQQAVLRDAPGLPVVPAAHCTLQGFGGPERPLTDEQVTAIVELVRRWTAGAVTAPIRLEAQAVDAFDEERVPVIRLRAEPDLRPAIGALRRAAGVARVPAHDDIPVDDWILHLSLAYVGDADPSAWAPYARRIGALDAGAVGCTAAEVELVRYDGGPERTAGVFPLGSGSVRSPVPGAPPDP